jgi:hypothetical protein
LLWPSIHAYTTLFGGGGNLHALLLLQTAQYGLLMPEDNDFRYARFTDDENTTLSSPGHARAPAETSGEARL